MNSYIIRKTAHSQTFRGNQYAVFSIYPRLQLDIAISAYEIATFQQIKWCYALQYILS